MAYPALRGTATTATIGSGANSFTIDKPTGVASGDRLYVVINANDLDGTNVGNVSTWSLSGWSQGISRQASTGNRYNKSFVLERTADGTEGASFTFTRDTTPVDEAVDTCHATCIAFSGSSGTGATTSSDSGGAGSTTWTSPDLTTTQAESLVLRIWTSDYHAGGPTLSAYSSGLTEQAEINSTFSSIALTTEEQATAGATGTKTATASNSEANIMLVLEVKATAGASHPSSGALNAEAAAIAGTAAHHHAATGALAAAAATIAGSAAHLTLHMSTGALTAAAATIAGAAVHEHATAGTLAAAAATVAGDADHSVDNSHATSGALAAESATIGGIAEHVAPGAHDATGNLQAGDATLEGVADLESGEDLATDPKLIARRPNVHVDFGKRKKTPPPTPAPAQITNMPGHPPVPRPLAGGLLAALADNPLPAAPSPSPAPTAAPAAPAPTAASVPRATAAPVAPALPIAAVYAPLPAAPAPMPVVAGITPEQMTALLQRMDALSEGMSNRLVEVNKALQGGIERVTQLLEAERDARLAREKRERNDARAKEITARLLGGGG